MSISQVKTGARPAGRGSVCSARTSGVIVAVKRQVWRSIDGGRAERHSSTSGSMLPWPAARRRSASSSTTNRLRLRPIVVSAPDVRMWSARRPGVAITTCGRCARAVACVRMSAPPVTRIHFSDWEAPIARNCSYICSASSLMTVLASQ